MKTLIFFLAIVLIPFQSFAQPKVGEKAPDIHVTHWVNNGASPVAIQNKFIVLEFWATWCAPCLASLPHLNELQKQFGDRNDLVFLSMTDEKPEKIQKILPRFHFESNVVSDTTYATFKAYGVYAIPRSILIDASGVVRWTGNPTNLSTAVLNDFLAGKPIASYESEVTGNALLDSLFTQYSKIFSDKAITNAFRMSTPSELYSSRSNSRLGGAIYNVVQMGVKLPDLFANLLHCPKNQIILPASLQDKAISYYFKRSDLSGRTEGEGILLDKILGELNLEMSTSQEMGPVLTLAIVEEDKLKQANVSKENPRSSVSADESILAINNVFLPVLKAELQKSQNLRVDFADEEKYPGRYDITLNTSTFENLQKSLADYGLSLNKDEKPVMVYNFK